MNRRALTGFSIATVAILAAAGVYAVLALSSAAFSNAATPVRPALNEPSLELQHRLSRLAAQSLGPGHAVISADVELNLGRTLTTPVSYGEPLAIMRPHTAGAVARIRVGVLVGSTVSPTTLAKLQRSLAAAAGIEPSRGDVLTVTRVPLCFQGATGC